MKKHFLIAFLSVAMAGGLLLIFVVRSDRDDQSRGETRKVEQPLDREPAVTDDKSNGPRTTDNQSSEAPTSEATVASSAQFVASTFERTPAATRISAVPSEGTLGRQSSLASEGAQNRNAASPPAAHVAAGDSQVQPSSPTTTNERSEVEGIAGPGDPEPMEANPEPRVRRYPFTAEEEWQRYWHGWGSIDSFRATEAAAGGH